MKIKWAAIGIAAAALGAYAGYSAEKQKTQDRHESDQTYRISAKADKLPPPITRTGSQTAVFELETREIEAELAPGVTYEYWTYNGTVPGPFLRVREGDTVEIHLSHRHGGDTHALEINPFAAAPALAHGGEDESSGHDMDGHEASNPEKEAKTEEDQSGHATHSIDLHAVEGPGGGSVLMQVAPGQTKSFQFKALRPGLYVYHCASPHIPTHVANGMYGLILVEPKGGLSPADRELYIVQGEIYTSGKLGEKGLQKLSAQKLLAGTPEYFVFNGRVGSLTGENALQARVGETVRIFFGAGAHLPSYPHMIGAVWDKLYPEGDLLSQPHRNVQTTIVPPGGSAVMDLKFEVPGRYLLVDHSLPRAIDRGALAEIIVSGAADEEIFKKLP